MKQKFIEAVSDGDKVTIRLYLANELLLDPRGKSFNKMRTFAEMNVPDLYENNDGTDFIDVTTNWDQDLLFSLKNDLDSNFSKERLDFFEKVAKFVLKDKANSLAKERRVLTDLEKQQAVESEESILEEPLIHKKTLKERIKPFFKRQIKKRIITPLLDDFEETNEQ